MRALLIILMTLVLTVSATAASLHARLIRASNDREGHDPRLKNLELRLEKKFGYKFYHQLGEERVTLAPEKMMRLDLNEGFVLFVTAKGAEKKEHLLEIEWYSGKAMLVRSTVKITIGGRLFIKGPDVGNDSIVLSLSVRDQPL